MRHLAPAVAVVVLLAAQGASALPAATWLLAIGNNDGDGDDISLLYAQRDAQQVVEALQTEGGVSGHDTTVLLDRRADEVRDTLQDVNARIRERRASGTTALVVFYSGHADAESLHLDGSRLKMEELRKLVQGSPADLRLLIVDACRSGAVTHVKGVRPTDLFQIDIVREPSSEGLAIITSSAAGESSRESDRLQGSFFTHHLVNALRGAADQNGDGVVTLSEAYAYAYDQTLRSSGTTLDLQHPTYSYDVKGKGEVVLSKPHSAVGRIGYLRLGEDFVYLISEHKDGGAIVAEVAPSGAAKSLALPAKRYFVQERRPGEYREYEVMLEPGRDVDLSTTPYRSVRYDRLVRARGGERTYTNGLLIFAGVHGSVLAGEGASPEVIAGYSLDLPWLTVGARLRGATVASSGVDDVLPRRHNEYALGMTLQRFVDLKPLSLGFGVLMEGVVQQQTFPGARTAPTQNVFGGSFGGMLTAERHLSEGWAIHIEGGPVTELFSKTETNSDGTAGAVSLASPFTWWLAGGLVWRR